MDDFITKTMSMTVEREEEEHFRQLHKRQKIEVEESKVKFLENQLKKEKERSQTYKNLLSEKLPPVSMANGVPALKKDYIDLCQVQERLKKYLENNKDMKRKKQYTTYPLKHQQCKLWSKYIELFEKEFAPHMPAINYMIEKDKATVEIKKKNNIAATNNFQKKLNTSLSPQKHEYLPITSFPSTSRSPTSKEESPSRTDSPVGRN